MNGLSSGVIFYGILCIIMIIILIVYTVCVIIGERKKMKYYNSTLLYVTDWDKYNTMVKKQKRIIFLKKVKLYIFTFLVKIKGLLMWK